MIIEIDDTVKEIFDIEDNEIEWIMQEMIASVEKILGEIAGDDVRTENR
jgi:hypothetical protein